MTTAPSQLARTDAVDRVCALQTRALTAFVAGRRAETERLLGEAASLVEGTFGPDSPDLAALLNDLGCAVEDGRDFAVAEACFRRAAAIAEPAGPTDDDDLERLALDSISNLARVLGKQGRYAEAEPLVHRALERAECAFGPDSAETASALYDLGILAKLTCRFVEAEVCFRRAFRILERSPDPDACLLAALRREALAVTVAWP